MRHLLLIFVASCAATPPQRTLPEVEALRAELAKPGRFPVRHGLDVDPLPMTQAFDELVAAHHARLAARFAGELDALPQGIPPAAPDYGVVIDIHGDDVDSLAKSLAYEYVLEPNPERLALRGVFTLLPVQMSHQLGVEIKRVSAWLGFFHLARPAVSVCGRSHRSATLCLDYGGLDVLVVRMAMHGAMWVPQSIIWHQRGRR